MKIYPNFHMAIRQVKGNLLALSYPVENERWQSSDVKEKPGHEMREIFNTSFSVSVGHTNLVKHQEDIQPNLPWADDHFMERVGGQPLNPGEEWRNWPYANSADTHRDSFGKFSHTYMERYWPQFTRAFQNQGDSDINPISGMKGIRYRYGDLLDVANHLIEHPESRQAYLPVWFPEDTGVVHSERVPCTLGYHFMMRHGFLHMTYYIRSCDFTRHFRDDLYLSLRLQLWMLDELRSIEKIAKPDPQACSYNRQLFWDTVKPGLFIFHCASMHIFEADFQALQGEEK